MMPNLDGFGLIAELRADAALMATPVVLVSARAGEEATLEAIRAGADDYLVKPFSARELVARVDAQVQRRRFERRLAAAEQRLQATLAAAHMAAWEWCPSTNTLTASATSAEVFGLLAGQVLQSSDQALRLVHPDDQARHQALVRRAVTRGEGYHSEFRVIRPRDGHIAWLEERGNARRDAATGDIRLTGLVTDVTERKLAELALLQSEERARFIVRLDDALRPLVGQAEVPAAAAKTLAQYLGLDRVIYAEVDPDEDHCTVIGEYAPGVPSIAGRYRISDFGDAHIEAVRANRPCVQPDTSGPALSPAERARFASLQIGAFIAAPLVKDGRLVAILAVHNLAPRAWRANEIETVTLVASRCWESIERARVTRASGERRAAGDLGGRGGIGDVLLPAAAWPDPLEHHVQGAFLAAAGRRSQL